MSVGTDLPGHCVVCHENLFTERYIDNKIQRQPKPQWSEYTYKLSDGSNMKVCMCKDCQKDVDKVDVDEVMQTVKNGWLKEMEDNVTQYWTEEKKKNYIKHYEKIKIIKNKKKGVK